MSASGNSWVWKNLAPQNSAASLFLFISLGTVLAVSPWSYSYEAPLSPPTAAVAAQPFFSSAAAAAAYGAYALTTVAATFVGGDPAITCFFTAGWSFLNCLGHLLAASGLLPCWLMAVSPAANGTYTVVSLLSRGSCSSVLLLVLCGAGEHPPSLSSMKCLVANWSLLLLPGIFEAFNLPGSALVSQCRSMPWLIGSSLIICSQLRGLTSDRILSSDRAKCYYLRLMALIGVFAAIVACSWTLSLWNMIHQLGGVADVAFCLVLLCGAQSTLVFIATERKDTEIQEEALRRRHAFAALANMVRTPLSGIQALTKQSLAEDGSSLEDAMGLIQYTSHLLVRRVLDRTNLQSLELDMRFGPVHINELLSEAVMLIRPLLQQSTELNVIDGSEMRERGGSPIFEGDFDRLAQMLHGLLGIAVKYTFNGFISVSARHDAKGNMRIEIKDTGIGIQARHFGTSGACRATGRAGNRDNDTYTNDTYTDDQLSVQLAEAIVKAHNGTLTFTHTVLAGVGSTCIVVLPCKQSHTGDSEPVHLIPSELQRAVPRSVDSPDTTPNTSSKSLKSLVMQSSQLALPFDTPSPMRAPGLTRSSSSSRSGEAQADAARADLPRRSRCGFGFNDTDASSTGMLMEWLTCRKPEAVASLIRSEIDDPLADDMEIMCLDSENITHLLVQETLAGTGFSCSRVFWSEEILAELKDRFKKSMYLEFPRLILINQRLPGSMSGLETAKEIRLRYPDASLPIILMSGIDVEESRAEALKNRLCNAFLSKPFTAIDLLANVGIHTGVLREQLISNESRQHEELLKQILPESVIKRLKQGQQVIADEHDEVTVVFSDIVSFTTMSSQVSTWQVVSLLDELFTKLDDLTDKHGVYKVETIGDCYMVVAGHDPSSRHDHADRAVHFAMDMVTAASKMRTPLGDPLQLRVGMHSGPVAAGVVGSKGLRYCLFGDTVNTASRMESTSFPMCIQLSSSTQAILQASQKPKTYKNTQDLGERMVKGKGAMRSWLLEWGEWKAALRRHYEAEYKMSRASLDKQNTTLFEQQPLDDEQESTPNKQKLGLLGSSGKRANLASLGMSLRFSRRTSSNHTKD